MKKKKTVVRETDEEWKKVGGKFEGFGDQIQRKTIWPPPSFFIHGDNLLNLSRHSLRPLSFLI